MTKDELLAKIVDMRRSAESLDEPEKTFKLSDTDQLEIKVQALAAAEIAQKMQAIELPSIAEMDANIAKARDATIAHSQRVAFLDKALDFITGVLRIVI